MTLYQDKKWLYQKYMVEMLSQREIAAQCGCCHKTISKWLTRHGIQTRSISEGKLLYHRGKKVLDHTSGSPVELTRLW